MTRSALAILMLALGLGSAAAQIGADTGIASPRLRLAATVSADIVRIGDLVENAGAAANTPIFRSPDPGQTGAVPARAVIDAVRPYGLIAIDARGVSEIAVTRISHAITVEEIEARIAQLLTARYSLGKTENLKLTMDRELRAIQLETNASVELALVRLGYETSSRRFDVTFELGNGSRKQWRYTGTAFETVEVAVPNRALAKGELIRANDIVIERRAKTEFSNEPPAPVTEVLGRAARRSVRSGQALRLADVMKPELVMRGEMVTLHYEVPGITITMRGKALDSGAEGESVNVLNELSKRTIQGVVSGAGHVTMASRSQPRVVAQAARLGDGESESNP
jgi:flagella basal body P-ring formation protein FlgA